MKVLFWLYFNFLLLRLRKQDGEELTRWVKLSLNFEYLVPK